MAKKQINKPTGVTESGNLKEVVTARIGRVTIYKRGNIFYVYYRENGKKIRRAVEGTLATVRATASTINASLENGASTPFQYCKESIDRVVADYLDNCNVTGKSFRTVERYRTGLKHFQAFATNKIKHLEQVDVRFIDGFVKHLSQKSRSRNGAENGRKESYTKSGIIFILETCRTLWNWAAKRRYLPPYTENPFASFDIKQLRDDDGSDVEKVLTEKQMNDFWTACSEWQKNIFAVMATYGLRAGELTHLTIDDVDFTKKVISIRSKPEMLWFVKSRHCHDIPLVPEIEAIFRKLIGARKAGFVFLNKDFYEGESKEKVIYTTTNDFRNAVKEVADKARSEFPNKPMSVLAVVTDFLRQLGQIPEKRLRQEYMKLTSAIGCGDNTRVHNLRHLFATRAQELGMSPLLVSDIVGHASTEMTKKYTSAGMDSKRAMVQKVADAILQPETLTFPVARPSKKRGKTS